MKNSKVISFPRSKKDTPPQSLEDVQNNVLKVRMENVNRLTEELSTMFLTIMDNQGINIVEEDFMKLNAFMTELTKAYICKSMNIEHIFIDLAETYFKLIDDGENVRYEYNLPKFEE